MAQRRLIYFLAHMLMVVIGALAALASATMEEGWLKATTFALGTSISAAGLCGMVIWVYIASSENSLALLKVLDAAGLEWIYPKRAAQIRDEYARRLASARKRVDIIGFGLTDFKRDYMEGLGAISNQATIRILLLKPTSPYASQRDKEENQGVGTIASQIDEFIRRFKERYGCGSEKLQIRFYTSLPEVNIFRIDDEIFWGPYLSGIASGNTPTMRVRRGGYLYDVLEKHFEHTWNEFYEDV